MVVTRNGPHDVKMNSQINKGIHSAIAERVIAEIPNMVSSLSSGSRDTDFGASSNNQENTNGTTGFNSKITLTDCRSAFDLRDTNDLSLHIYPQISIQ